MLVRILYVLMILFPAALYGIDGKPDIRRACLQTNDTDIVVSWTIPVDTCNSFNAYYIYSRPDTTQAFTLIDSVKNFNQTTYLHKGVFQISKTWQYYIVINFTCSGGISISDTIAVDLLNPDPVGIDSVSINPTNGSVIIGWKAGPDKDIFGYILYEFIDPDFVTIDTIQGTSTEIAGKNTASESYSYTIAPIDSCMNKATYFSPHSSILLNSFYDSCSQIVTLNWSNYIGWNGIPSAHIIYLRRNGNAAQIIDTVDGNINIYKYKGIAGDTIIMYISAIHPSSSSIRSTSNIRKVAIQKPAPPLFNYLSNVTVLNNQINIKWISDPAAAIKNFIVMRSRDSSRFDTISIVPVSPSSSYSYIDTATKDLSRKYFYQVVVRNVCDQFISWSNISNNIPLQITGSKDKNELKWRKYNVWPFGARDYALIRGTDIADVFTWNTLVTLPDNQFAYDDSPLPLAVGNTGFCYYVEATENPGNPFGLQEISRSNVVCDIAEAIIHFPNAFVPAGLNRIFKPVGIYIDYQRSYMRIYNRWGEKVYESLDLKEGWDGTDMDGNALPGAGYLYIAFVRGLDGNITTKKGIVNLIR